MGNNMEKGPQFNQEEEKVIDGKRYRRIFSGYTIREYFSHETEEKGPGPGWDTRWSVLEKYEVKEPSGLPDEPYYYWEEVDESV